ncbi:MAG: FtsX-like permease family protein [Alistipes sp.]|nr:FtsX-like permease family protein [Alistipes sp.]
MLWSKFARRYLLSRKSHSVINLIASISVISVAVPVAAMVVLLSIFNGLGKTVEQMYTAFDADITATPARGQTFDLATVDFGSLKEVNGVEAVTTYLEQMAVASFAGRRATLMLRGVDTSYTAVAPIDDYIVRGEWRTQGAWIDGGDRREQLMVAGYGIAAELGMPQSDSRIELYAVNRRQFSSLVPMSGVGRCRAMLAGIYMVNADLDSGFAMCDLSLAQELFNYPGRASHIAFAISDSGDENRIRRELQSVLGDGFEVRTRDEKNVSLVRIMTYEKRTIFIIAFMVTLVAAFAVVGSVVMLLTDKRRDIATLRALGAPWSMIRRIFIGEGVLMTVIGGAAGIAAGLALCWAQSRFDLVTIPGGSPVGSYPVSVVAADIAVVAAAVVAVGYAVSSLTVRSVLKHES